MIKSEWSLANAPTRVPVGVDTVGVGLSSLCLLHCLAAPILAGGMPLLSAFAEAEWAHKAFVLAAIPISGFALITCCIHRTNWLFVGLTLVGLTLLLAAAFVERFHDYETPLTVIGACLVAGAHLVQRQRKKRAKCCVRNQNS